MTREDIVRMAREAGELKCDCCLPCYEETDIEGFEGFLERFANLVAASEREECAKLCEMVEDDDLYFGSQYALAIRERGAR
jgi:hypothetical protein